MVNTAQDNTKLTKVKVRFTLRAGMVKVDNQGLDDRYICLRSHRISHPVVSGLRHSHSNTFSTRFPRLVSVSEEVRAKKQRHKRHTIPQQNFRLIEFRSRIGFLATTITSNAPCLAKGNL